MYLKIHVVFVERDRLVRKQVLLEAVDTAGGPAKQRLLTQQLPSILVALTAFLHCDSCRAGAPYAMLPGNPSPNLNADMRLLVTATLKSCCQVCHLCQECCAALE